MKYSSTFCSSISNYTVGIYRGGKVCDSIGCVSGIIDNSNGVPISTVIDYVLVAMAVPKFLHENHSVLYSNLRTVQTLEMLVFFTNDTCVIFQNFQDVRGFRNLRNWQYFQTRQEYRHSFDSNKISN